MCTMIRSEFFQYFLNRAYMWASVGYVILRMNGTI